MAYFANGNSIIEKFQVFMSRKIQVVVLWFVMPDGRGSKVPEMLVFYHITTWRHNPQHHNVNLMFCLP
jgi:hypothetical protein